MRFKTLSLLILLVIFSVSNIHSQKSQDICETPDEPIVLNTINKCTSTKVSDRWNTKLSFKKPERFLFLRNRMLQRACNTNSKGIEQKKE